MRAAAGPDVDPRLAAESLRRRNARVLMALVGVAGGLLVASVLFVVLRG
jgi:hypothetical protein